MKEHIMKSKKNCCERTYPVIDMKATGKNINRLRLERNLSISEIADFMDFSGPQAVYRWINGETLPSLDNMYALSIMLGVDIKDIIVSEQRHFCCDMCTAGCCSGRFGEKEEGLCHTVLRIIS